MRAPLIASAIALTAGAALAGAPHPPAHRLQLAAQSQTPGAPLIGETTQPPVFVPYGGGGYAPPVVTNGLFMADGDSRVANGGGALYSGGSTYQVTTSDTNTWVGTLGYLDNNVMIEGSDWNYGVGASSSAGIAARENVAANYCAESNAATSAICFLASGAIRTSTSGATALGATAINVSSTTGLTSGMHIDDGEGSGFLYANTTTTSATNPIPLSNATLRSIANAIPITFAPVTAVNAYWNFLDATQLGWTVTDPDFYKSATGTTSACSNPAKLVFFGTGTNDANLPIAQSLRNLSYILDNYGPSACNKIVVSFNEMPRGLATALSEVHTPSAGTFTATNGANFYADQGLWYTPGGVLGGPNTIGANDGTKLTGLSYPCAPLTRQYCVNPADGVYTTAAGDNGAQLEVNYTWKAGSGPGQSLLTIHDWYNSSAATFVDPISGFSYNCGPNNTPPLCSGAQYNRPWVHVFDSWGAIVDPGSGSNYYPLPYFSQDVSGLHPLPNAGKAIARLAIAAIPTGSLGTTPIYDIPVPTQAENFTFAGNSSTSTAARSPTTCAVGNNTTNYYLTSLNPVASSGLYTVGGTVNTSAISGIPHGTTVDCIDITNNQLHMTAAAAATTTNTGSLFVNDPTNLLTAIDHRLVTNTAITNCGGATNRCGTPSGAAAGFPTTWTFVPASGDLTALNAGTLVMNYGVETNPLGDGYDDFILQVGGISGASGGPTLQINLNTQVLDRIIVGEIDRGICRVSINKGPNGHLWGSLGVKVAYSDTQATFTAPGTTANTYTVYGGAVSGGGLAQELVDKDVASGPLTFKALTPPFKALTAPTNAGIVITFNYSPNEPVSETVRISGCAFLHNLAN